MDKPFLPLPHIPVATYRLQFNNQFRFRDANVIIGYLHDLGITDLYSSPYLKAKEGSLHGYDIVDHSRLNPEIGTTEEFMAMVGELKHHGMGQIYDVVPNHMCIVSKDNRWWMDVLENGMSSPFADYFDIDWDPVQEELVNKVLLPVLGDQYGKVLENRELALSFEDGAFFVDYYGERFPVRPDTYLLILEHRKDELDQRLGGRDPSYVAEFMSIITALKHLPCSTSREREKIEERIREKEVIKRRLAKLCGECPRIGAFIRENTGIFNGRKGDSKSFDLLDKLLMEQPYRLSYWPVATEEINYRRFFDINSLAAIRVERPKVFEEAHRFLFQLIKEGTITGLRIDHPDGLYNPSEYFEALQRGCFTQIAVHRGEELVAQQDPPFGQSHMISEIQKQYDEMIRENPGVKPFYIVGEKILTRSERMPEEWRIFSTTGYVFLNSLNGIFIETRNAKIFDRIYTAFIKKNVDYPELVRQNKKLIMEVAMTSEINTIGRRLSRMAKKTRYMRDFTLNSLIKAIMEVVAHFPVYRSYINSFDVKDRDRQHIEAAVSKAKRANPAISSSIFDYLQDVLLLRFPDYLTDEDRGEWLDFTMRFQQLTGPVMAKGIEDTTFYVYNRLVSLNEVGGSPERFGNSLETFHGQNIERSKFWPHALITTATHDSKRGEDVRARINVLSEIPVAWKERLYGWGKANRAKKMTIEGQLAPDWNEEYLLYQALLGTWPMEATSEGEYEVFRKRIKAYVVKAIREAKVNSSWISPNLPYEEAATGFVYAIMQKTPENHFLEDFLLFQRSISWYGMFNALSQVLLKITSPGVADFYQGTELWDLTLVDPDNRGPVDYDKRMGMLREIKKREQEVPPGQVAKELMARIETGIVKLFVIYKALNSRRASRAVYEKGRYRFLHVTGEKSHNVCAFSRRLGDRSWVTAVPRFLTRLIDGPGQLPLGKEVWMETIIAIPAEGTAIGYRNVFTGGMVETVNHDGIVGFLCADVFKDFPVALLERISHGPP